MEENTRKSPPPHGWIEHIAKLAGCSRHTVSQAIRNNSRGIKAEKVRKLYQDLYGSMENKKNIKIL